jgi:hypothetical protein
MIFAAPRFEIVSYAAEEVRGARSRPFSSIREETPWPKAAFIALSSLIACRREISGTRCDDLIDRLRDNTVLKKRFGQIDDVVDNDFCAVIL